MMPRKLHIIFFLLLQFIFLLSYSQYHTSSKKAMRYFDKALEYFDARNDTEAKINLNRALAADPDFIEALMMRAQIYKDNQEYDKAIIDFNKALEIKPDFYPPGYMVLASVNYHLGNYKEAVNNIQYFISLNNFKQISASEASDFLEKAKFALQTIENPVPFNPVNMGDSINSIYSEYWPSLSIDEKTLIFTVLLPKNPYEELLMSNMQEDFYFSERNDSGVWMARKTFGNILNTPDNEGAQTVSSDGNELYFTACNRIEGLGRCDIFYSTKNQNKWSVPVDLPSPLNSAFSEKHPSLSSDRKVLYFASDRPGGIGGLDIWYSLKNENGNWSIPLNMGNKINTPGDEQSPFIHPDNQSLYFCSTGHNSLGKGDIFISRMSPGGEWGPAVNIGYPINTKDNEIGLIVNASGNKAYFATDREKSKAMDIYSFYLYPEARPIPVSYMKGRVYDSGNYKGIQASFQLMDLENGELVMEINSNEGEGDYLVPLPADKDYALIVSHPGYLFYSENFNFTGEYSSLNPFMKDVPLKRVKSGEKVVLKNIFFGFDSYILEKESATELNVVIDFLTQNNKLKIEISGHTDNIGLPKYNQVLSENRAKAVVDFLVENGIARSRLSFKGYGDLLPAKSNETEEGRAENRRTELKIVD
jgi:outer membrane protein OmpA-like peptidoglycan-associated protein